MTQRPSEEAVVPTEEGRLPQVLEQAQNVLHVVHRRPPDVNADDPGPYPGAPQLVARLLGHVVVEDDHAASASSRTVPSDTSRRASSMASALIRPCHS